MRHPARFYGRQIRKKVGENHPMVGWHQNLSHTASDPSQTLYVLAKFQHALRHRLKTIPNRNPLCLPVLQQHALNHWLVHRSVHILWC